MYYKKHCEAVIKIYKGMLNNFLFFKQLSILGYKYFTAMKNTITNYPAKNTAVKKRYSYAYAFEKKNAIIRNIEIIVACVVAFIIGMGVSGHL